MSNEKRKKGANQADEASSYFIPYFDDADVVQRMVRLGICEDGIFLSNDRIAEIAASDADEEKRHLADRLLHLQKFASQFTTMLTLRFAAPTNNSNILNPLEQLEDFIPVRVFDPTGKYRSPESDE